MSILYNIYFSARGTTELCAEYIGTKLNMKMETYNWCSDPCETQLEVSSEDILLFSMPVYGGFIPQICVHMAEKLKGSHTPAIIAAVYGNRHYDNALLQMKDILEKQGFRVIAAGAFLAEHSIFPAVAAGRPDEKDRAAMTEFAEKCRQILADGNMKQYQEIEVPGMPGYDASAYKGVALKPYGDESCIRCKVCTDACPVDAINLDNPRETDNEQCISCGACIRVCPVGARNYHGEAYQAAGIQFAKKCSEYRKPEMYYAAVRK